MARHRFYISLNGVGQKEFEPYQPAVKFVKGISRDFGLVREELDMQLTIMDKDIFLDMYNVEVQKCLCNVADFRIEEICCGEGEGRRWFGRSNFVKFKWNIDKCEVSGKPDVIDEWTCVLDNLDQEKNFFDIPNPQVILTRIGDLEYLTCGEWRDIPLGTKYTAGFPPPPIGSCLPSDAGHTAWRKLYTKAMHYPWFSNQQPWYVETKWVREYVNTVPPTSGWIQVDANKWVKPVNARFVGFHEGTDIFTAFETTDAPEVKASFDKVMLEFSIIETKDIDNGRTLSDVLSHSIGHCHGIKSFFFNIDVDVSSFVPFNDVYDYAKKNLWYLKLFNVSDIVLHDADNNGTNTGGLAGRYKPSQLLNDLINMFELDIWYDESIGYIRIEHKSFRRFNKLIDLTSDALEGYIKYEYEYDDAEVPKRESLTAVLETSDSDFDDGYITYDITCNDRNGRDNDIKMTIIHTNLIHLFENQEYLEDKGILNGILLVSVDENDLITRMNGHKVPEIEYLNGSLANSNIVRYVWNTNRPFCFGNVNDKEMVEFQDVRKTRKLADVIIPFACDIYNAISPKTTGVKTKIGIADILSIEYDATSETAKLELIV